MSTHQSPKIQLTLFVDLPNELLNHIVSYLTQTARKRLSQTCRLLKSITEHSIAMVCPIQGQLVMAVKSDYRIRLLSSDMTTTCLHESAMGWDIQIS